MKILVVTQYFWPENFRINDLVAGLVERGHQVTVLTGTPNYPSGKVYPGYGWTRRTRERYMGAEVVRAPLISRGRGRGLRLALNYLSFALAASIIGPLRLPRDYDAIFVHEPSPVTVGLPAIAMKARSRAPILFWILDLWPESVAAASNLRSPLILGWIGRLTRWIYARCDLLLVPSRAYGPRVQAVGGAAERIRYFPNWAEPMFTPRPRAAAPPAPLPGGFRVMFAGNVGAAQDFPTILAAAERLRGHTGIHWAILGDGRMLEWVRGEVARRRLADTVHLLGQHPAEDMPAFFAHADAMLVSLKRDPIFALTVPAKVQAYLACGRPVIAMLDGEGGRIVEDAGAGIACRAEDPDALAEAVLALHGMAPEERERLGAAGLEYARREFHRGALFDRLEAWMREAGQRN